MRRRRLRPLTLHRPPLRTLFVERRMAGASLAPAPARHYLNRRRTSVYACSTARHGTKDDIQTMRRSVLLSCFASGYGRPRLSSIKLTHLYTWASERTRRTNATQIVLYIFQLCGPRVWAGKRAASIMLSKYSGACGVFVALCVVFIGAIIAKCTNGNQRWRYIRMDPVW